MQLGRQGDPISKTNKRAGGMAQIVGGICLAYRRHVLGKEVGMWGRMLNIGSQQGKVN
jgi:hypothetical protein